MTRKTRVRFSVATNEGHTTHFSTPELAGMAESIRIFLEFDNGRGKVISHVVDLPIKFLDPDEIQVHWTDPPPSTEQMRAVGERLVQLAEELHGDE